MADQAKEREEKAERNEQRSAERTLRLQMEESVPPRENPSPITKPVGG